MKEYKVITQNDKWFSGRFDGAALAVLLNNEARLGWEVKSMATASREGMLMGGGKDELVVLLERVVREAAPTAPSAKQEKPRETSSLTPAEESSRAAARQDELDRRIASIEATITDPTERQRLKLRAIADYC